MGLKIFNYDTKQMEELDTEFVGGRHRLKTVAAPATAPTNLAANPYDVLSNSGTIPAGAVFVSFFNNGSVAGTLDGKPFPVNAQVTYPFIPNRVWGAIPYDFTGTSVLKLEARDA